MSTADLAEAAAREGRRLAALGFMACTAGNLSVRLPGEPLRVLVSMSGIDKAQLTAERFIACGADGAPLAGDPRKPSDETRLHLALYQATGCGAVAHGHPPQAVALSLADPSRTRLTFSGIEMQKAFAGTRTHACERTLPIIENSQDMEELARWALATRQPDVPAVLVRGHGVYAWGTSPAEAGRHLETVEWLCHLHALMRLHRPIAAADAR